MTQEPQNSIPTLELLRTYDRPGPRYTSYPTAPMWNDSVDADVYRQALQNASSKTDESLAIYCHIPFCRARCYYCGCNTCIVRDPERVNRYLKCMYREIDFVAEHLDRRRGVSQIHFGGGTPTYIGVDGLGRTIQHMRDAFELGSECELSLEIDPRETTPEDIRQLRQIGFNRLSLGVQDFDDAVQKAVNRIQSIESVQSLITTAREENFKGINVDLIYGLPLQTQAGFEETLATAIEMRPDRVALYSFAYLPKLRANQAKIRPEDLPDTEAKYLLFAGAVRMFTEAGYRQIGMDHFALPNDELALAQEDGRLYRNFMGYTVQTAPDMIGLGMSSIGYIDNTFVQNASKLSQYEQQLGDGELAVYRGLSLTEDDLIRQYLISNLMCNFMMSFDGLKEQFGVDYGVYFKEEDSELDPLINDGFLIRDNDGLKVTLLGRTFVRNIAMVFDAYLRDPDRKATFSRTI